jgi:hypothetical protein
MSTHLDDILVAILAQAAGMAAAGAGLAITEAFSDMDGRSDRSLAVRKFSIRLSQFDIALQNPVFDAGWFVDQFRCSRASFDFIVELVKRNWLCANNKLGDNATFSIRQRTAVALHYLAHSGNVSQSAKMFGMGKTSALR